MKQVLQNLFRVLSSRQKCELSFLIIFMVFSAMMELAGLALLMPAVSAFADQSLLQNGKILPALYRFSGASSPQRFILYCAAALIVFYLVKNVFSAALVHAQSYFAKSFSKNVAGQLFQKYLQIPYETFTEQGSSAMTAKLDRIHHLSGGLLLP